jgi:hypothetical protein
VLSIMNRMDSPQTPTHDPRIPRRCAPADETSKPTSDCTGN